MLTKQKKAPNILQVHLSCYHSIISCCCLRNSWVKGMKTRHLPIGMQARRCDSNFLQSLRGWLPLKGSGPVYAASVNKSGLYQE